MMKSTTYQKFSEAARVGNIELLEELLHDQAIATTGDAYDDLPNEIERISQAALQLGHLKFVEKLCSHFLQLLYTPDYTGETLLQFALKKNNLDFFFFGMRRLLEYFDGIHPVIYDYFDRGQSDRFVGNWRQACKCRSQLVNKEGKSLVYMAVEREHLDAVKILMESPLLNNIQAPSGSTILYSTVRLRNFEMMEIILKHQPQLTGQPDEITGNTPLYLAVSLNDFKIVERLLAVNASALNQLNKEGLSPFFLAASMGYIEIFNLFLNDCPECHLTTLTTTKRQNALHIAVEKKFENIAVLIANDDKLFDMINQPDDDGNTPLHIAARNDDLTLQDILLKGKAKVESLKNKDGLTFQQIFKAHKDRKDKEKRDRLQERLVKAMQELQSSLLVMSTLVTTITFTAAFTMPGGYNSSDPNQGTATLVALSGFDIFLISNAISMCSSVVATAALILFSVVFTTLKKFNIMKVAIGAIGICVISMLVTFAATVWLVVSSQRKWLAIFIVVVTLLAVVGITLLIGHVKLYSGYEDEDEGINTEKAQKEMAKVVTMKASNI